MTNPLRSLPIMNARVIGAVMSCLCCAAAVVKPVALSHRQDRFMS